ncbi:uncharacterized protein At5g08430 isoform X1 [Impatiens glandulifera]|uniref:uncharacterized protein At5g08430 isoform X1 n=1 Tax=Impatiens glandulifera TaxID=253017 RepID=UPI001FB15C46|nr:uncharacterized protein At5g08430 isoform X1 [Impatiens glandulifera]
MDSREDNEWVVDDPNDVSYSPVGEKRKYRAKKTEFIGWGSRQLIEFLISLGKDTSQQMSQYEATSVINEYVNNNSLYHPQKKKKILCDEKLHSLFGKKTVARIKVYDLLEPHYAENEEDWDNFFSDSDEKGEEDADAVKRYKSSSSKWKCDETPKSCFASIVPSNIKLVYLKKNLIVQLLENPETFEAKVVGSFVKVKADPMDTFAKYSYQLQPVIGVKMGSGLGDAVTETLLEVPTDRKEINLSMLSTDNFTEEECNDLRERVKKGSIKKPTVVELQEKVQQLHEDITKHWIKRELEVLQNLIDQANEKGWRKELFEYLDRRDLLDKKSEQERLLTEIPKVIAEELELETPPQEGSDGISPRPSLPEPSNKLVQYLDVNQAVSNHDDGAVQNNKEQHANGESSHRQDNQVLDRHANTWEEDAYSDEDMADFLYYEDSHPNAETSEDKNTVENQTTEGVTPILPDSNDNQTTEGVPPILPDSNDNQTTSRNEGNGEVNAETSKDKNTVENQTTERVPPILPDINDNLITSGNEGNGEVNAETSKDKNKVENQTTEGVPPILPDSNDNQTTSRNEGNGELKTERHNSVDTMTRELVELSDDDDDDDYARDIEVNRRPEESYRRVVKLVETPELVMWHYLDPQGVVQGPFPLVSLKRWYDYNYFPSNFKIWKTGENLGQAVLLGDMIRMIFTSK